MKKVKFLEKSKNCKQKIIPIVCIELNKIQKCFLLLFKKNYFLYNFVFDYISYFQVTFFYNSFSYIFKILFLNLTLVSLISLNKV